MLWVFCIKAEQNVYGSCVLFDGEQHKEGKGFALPRGISKYEVSGIKPFEGEKHLFFDLRFEQGWTGCGWNWASWDYLSKKIVDIKNFKTLELYISVSPCSINDITFQLTSKNISGEPDFFGRKVSIFPMIKKRDKYTHISIPIDKLEGFSLDSEKVWGFNIGVFAGKSSSAGNCRIYIDNIELIP
jgi:hypothetical protein